MSKNIITNVFSEIFDIVVDKYNNIFIKIEKVK